MQAMQTEPHRPIVRRAGLALIAVGLLDIAYMAWCLAHGQAYSSSLNLFAVIGGVFLLKGSLRAAAVVRGFGLFLLSATLAACLLLPAIMPAGLLWTRLRLGGASTAAGAAVVVGVVLVLSWVVKQLGAPAVLQAQGATAAHSLRPLWPVAAGVGVALLIATGLSWMQGTGTARRALAEAKAQHGAGYRYYVSSLSYRSNGTGSTASGVVTAWKDDEILELPFDWRD